MNPVTKDILNIALKKMKELSVGEIISLSSLMKGDPLWEANYSRHSGVGRAFYNWWERRGWQDGTMKIKALADNKPMSYEVVST
jgi:hypothetical protein